MIRHGRVALIVRVLVLVCVLQQQNSFVCAATIEISRVKASLHGLWDILTRQKSSTSTSTLTTTTTPKYKGLTIIGAGFGRTGTKSIEQALHTIGHRHIYDVTAILAHNHTYRWREAAKQWKYHQDTTLIQELVKEIEYLGYTVTLDTPMNLFAIPLAKIRPHAKVLYSIRDNEEKWLQSIKLITNKFIVKFTCRPWKWIVPDMINALNLLPILWDNVPIDDPKYPNHITRPLPWYEYCHIVPITQSKYDNFYFQLYKDFRKLIEDTIEPDRLLIFNVKEGWEPLINFLELSESHSYLMNEPFPFVNDQQTVKIVVLIMDIIAIGLPLWISIILALIWKVGVSIKAIVRKLVRVMVPNNDDNNKDKKKKVKKV